MGSEWREMTLGDVIELKRGYDLPSRDRRDGSFPIVSSSGISGRHIAAKAKAPGVVIGRYGTLGEVHYITEDYWPLNTALYVCNFKGNDPQFVSYFLRSLDFGAYSDKAAVPGLNRNDLHTAQVSLPPLPEQRAIAHILGTFDDKIELNRKRNETLEAMARALFKDWFVDFGPVRAKLALSEAEGMEGRDPYLPAEIWDLFPDKLDDEGKPEGWEHDMLASFTGIKNGHAFKSKDWRDQGVPVVKIGSVKPPFVDLSQVSFIDSELALEKSAFRLMAGDMLVGLTGYVGETGRIPPSNNLPMLNQRVGKFEPSNGLHSFVYACVRMPDFKFFAESKGHGSAQANVSTSDLLNYPVINPGVKILEAFCKTLDPSFAKALNIEGETEFLTQLRDTLLPKLISGELRVGDVDGFLDRAMQSGVS